MIIDTHIHLDDASFNEDRELLIEEFKKNNIEKIVNIGADISTSENSIALANKYDFIYATIGIHPSETAGITQKDMDTLRELAKNEKVVAIGEIGLDYYYDTTDKETQKLWFKEQLKLAKELNLPIVIHSRDAAKDTIDILKETNIGNLPVVVHCYSYSLESSKEFFKMGCFFGIGGVLTFNNAKKLKEVVKFLPLSSIVLETDAPYLSPVPNRGKRNSSLNLKYVIDEIARLKEIDTKEVILQTYDNAHRLYPKMKSMSL